MMCLATKTTAALLQRNAAPQWASTPPSEPGWYWACTKFVEAQAVHVRRHGVYWNAVGESLESQWVGKPPNWLWWPVAIQPPEAP